MGQRYHKVLYEASAAGAGDWVKLDGKFEEIAHRALQGTVASGDTIGIEATTVEKVEDITPVDIVELEEFDDDFAKVLVGNWTYVRAVKTGTNGVAKVQGYL